jgi:hypothetical protein
VTRVRQGPRGTPGVGQRGVELRMSGRRHGHGLGMADRKATVYRRAGLVLVNRVDTTTEGIPVSTDQVLTFGLDASPDLVGQGLLDVVRQARSHIPPLSRSEWVTGFDPVLRAAGVRSWRAFIRGCRDLSVFDEGDELRLVPSVNKGAREGFSLIDASEIRTTKRVARTVGEAVMRALDLSIPSNE